MASCPYITRSKISKRSIRPSRCSLPKAFSLSISVQVAQSFHPVWSNAANFMQNHFHALDSDEPSRDCASKQQRKLSPILCLCLSKVPLNKLHPGDAHTHKTPKRASDSSPHIYFLCASCGHSQTVHISISVQGEE